MNDGSADGWTDNQNFGRYNKISSQLFVAGHKNIKLILQCLSKQQTLNPKKFGKISDSPFS